MSETSTATSTASATPGTAATSTSSTSSTQAASASTTTTAQTSSAPNSQGAQGQAPSSSPTGQASETEAQRAARELGDADMDALVTLKINGETVKKPLREAIKLSQLEQASYEKMKKAAEIEKQYQLQQQQLKQWIESNPEALFQQYGKNFDDIATDYFAKKYELAQMSPEQRELLETKERLQQYEANDRKSKEDVVKSLKEFFPEADDNKLFQYSREELVEALNQKQNESRQAEQALEQELLQAWQETGLPKHKWFGSQIAFAMMNHQKATKTPLLAKDAAAKVKADFQNFVKEVVKSMDAKAIHEHFGDDVLAKIREYEVARVSQQPSAPLKVDAGPSQEASQKKYVNQFEWRKAMGLA